MAEYPAVVRAGGRVTIPAPVRRMLGIEPGGWVDFTIRDGQVWVTRGKSVVERTAGAFKVAGPSLSAEELRAVAEKEIADDVEERLRRSGAAERETDAG